MLTDSARTMRNTSRRIIGRSYKLSVQADDRHLTIHASNGLRDAVNATTVMHSITLTPPDYGGHAFPRKRRGETMLQSYRLLLLGCLALGLVSGCGSSSYSSSLGTTAD